MKIVLLGYMGSGKSTIGYLLANTLACEFLDLDTYMERAEGISIPEVFEQRGEIYFRKKEEEYLKEVLALEKDLVFSTGGGTPVYGRNMETMLRATPNVVYLKVSLDKLVQRLAPEKEGRPLIARIPDQELHEFIGKHLFERSFFYQKARYVVACDGKTPEEIVSEIQSLIQSL
ncbi:MAG: shikimate kinase [Bacteroidota bacterium]